MIRCVPVQTPRYEPCPAAVLNGPETHSGRGWRDIHHCHASAFHRGLGSGGLARTTVGRNHP